MFTSEIEKLYKLAKQRLEDAQRQLKSETKYFELVSRQRECKHERIEEDKKSFALFSRKCLDCGYTEWY